MFSFLSIKLAAQQRMESKLECGSVPQVANLLCEKFWYRQQAKLQQQ